MSSAPTANIYTILTHYALKQNNPLIHFNEFCEYMRRYSQRYLEQQEELIKYVGNSHEAVMKELLLLESDKKVAIINNTTEKKSIVVAGYFIEKLTERYRDIESNPAIPFPIKNKCHIIPQWVIAICIKRQDDLSNQKISCQFLVVHCDNKNGKPGIIGIGNHL